MNLPKKVRLVEVGPRDGLQNEKQPIEVADKIRLVDDLSAAGLDYIEVGSFVSPKWVPQMAGSAEVFAGIRQRPGVTYAALAPNLKGFEAALESGVKEVAVFAAASEAFSQRNINCSIKDSLERFVPVLEAARQHQVRVRGYISCVLGCPYDGDVDPRQVAWVARELQQMGCYEVSLGDTIGVGTAGATRRLIEAVASEVPRERLAGHFHDTYGQALANIYASLLEGIAVFDETGGRPRRLSLRQGRHRQRRQRRRPLPAERPGDPYRGRHARPGRRRPAYLRGARQEQRVASGESVAGQGLRSGG